ncbi:unc-93-like protein a [Plakobranchus ocellatus]|uniref:Unc-93-like protein a n=1 Tax=Plakobranchus ocellatus TaxID=259542 RepID=A0AAV3ZL51_9GAST|nr:unc-93-like protein a [Plakobranchus ocellatus]
MVYPSSVVLHLSPAAGGGVSHLNTISEQAVLEDPQHPASALSSVQGDYDVTEKCMSWRNSCTASERFQPTHAEGQLSREALDNGLVYSANGTVDNAHCQPSFQYQCSGQKFTNIEYNYYSSKDGGSAGAGEQYNKPMLAQKSIRIRRDSEESEQSMDTNYSLASSPYAYSVSSACTDSMSNGSSADNLIADPPPCTQNEIEPPCVERNDSCTTSFDVKTEKLGHGVSQDVVSPSPQITIDECSEAYKLTPEPFSSAVEEVDPEYASNPPVVTDNLIVVEDESFLQHSQHSLVEPYTEGHMCHSGSLTRAATLPDLQAYHRYHEEYDINWVYQDARIFLSENMLAKSMCSLVSVDSLDPTDKSNILYNMDNKFDRQRQGLPYRQLMDSEGNPVKIVPSSDHTIVMILLSLCVGVLFIAMGAIRNIQSSLYPEDGLGVTSLALIFAGYTLGSLFSSPLMQHVQPRTCLIISIIPNILFLLANVSQTACLLALVSLLQGISMAIIWSTISTYMTFLAQGRALHKGEALKSVCSHFFNFFSLIYQCSVILGNLATSVLLKFGNSIYASDTRNYSSARSFDTEQKSLPLSSKPLLQVFPILNQSFQSKENTSTDSFLYVCGASFNSPGHVVDAGEPWLSPNPGTIYMLHGTFIGCTLVALGIAIFGVEPLNKSLYATSAKRPSLGSDNFCGSLKKHLLDMMHGCRDVKFILLVPLLMYSVMQFGFVSAEITAAFITCPIGIDQVGFSMVLFALGGFPTSFFCGFLTKKCGRLPLITLAAAMNLISLIILVQWHPSSSNGYFIHIMMFCWGLSDGIWISQANGLISSVFKHRYEATYGGMRVAQGLGVTILLSFSTFADMSFKVTFMMAACVLGLLGYLLMKLCLYCENRRVQLQQQQLYQIYRAPCQEDV